MQLVITFNMSYEIKFETDSVFCKSNTILISRKVYIKKGNIYTHIYDTANQHLSSACYKN